MTRQPPRRQGRRRIVRWLLPLLLLAPLPQSCFLEDLVRAKNRKIVTQKLIPAVQAFRYQEGRDPESFEELIPGHLPGLPEVEGFGPSLWLRDEDPPHFSLVACDEGSLRVVAPDLSGDLPDVCEVDSARCRAFSFLDGVCAPF